jgi:acyl-CoA reductase-like NAD-dependent aldehyde dehydrogenase
MDDAAAACPALTVTNPSNGNVLATDARASVTALDDAVAVAKVAFPGWAGATPAERAVRSMSEACACKTPRESRGGRFTAMAMEAVKILERGRAGLSGV